MSAGACCAGAPPKAGASFWRKGGWLLAALPLWGLAYAFLERFANLLTTRVFGLALGTRAGSAVAFFLYDAPKVLLLLSLVVLVVTFMQTYITPEHTRDVLARRAGAWGNLLAALFGIVTPFCSCSAIPLFIGFLSAGVPLGVTFSYLVAAPMVNEVALFLLLGMFGWKIALLYAGTGVTIAFGAGWVLGKLNLEHLLEPWVLAVAFQGRVPGAEELAALLQG